jgi:murein DD-endopeptidase MepM/ murein hydrolase activator NlpD
MVEITDQAQLDPAVRQAIDNLPAIVKSRAMGGGSATATLMKAPAAPQTSSLGILHDVLDALGARLDTVRSGLERRQALGRATPSGFPVVGWLSSLFGSRQDPINGGADFHSGLDISANYGTPVRATADGKVESAAFSGNYGNAILVQHGLGMATRYGHLSRFAVFPGQTVRRGDVIGYVGDTGRTTGPHLHYEILINGQAINPMRLLTRP